MKYDLICVIDNQQSGFFEQEIVKETLGNRLVFVDPIKFSNGETNVELSIPSNTEKVLLIGRVMGSPNDFIMNMTFAIDAVKRQGAEVDLFIPCLPYARQDRRNGRDVAITSQVMLRMFEQAGIGKLYVVDLHSTQMEGFAKFPIINIDSQPMLIESIKEKMKHYGDGAPCVIVSPDAGGVKRAKKYADALGLPIAIIHKTRDAYTNESISHNIVGSVHYKQCFVVDDMADSGGTLIDANTLLRQSGANSVMFAIGHPVLSKPKEGLEELDIVFLNTCAGQKKHEFTVKSIEEYFLENVLGIKLFEKGFGQ